MKNRPYQICTKTIMDTTDPHIIFNEKGESDYYTNFKENIEPNWHTDERGYNELMKIADKIKKTSSSTIRSIIENGRVIDGKVDMRIYM